MRSMIIATALAALLIPSVGYAQNDQGARNVPNATANQASDAEAITAAQEDRIPYQPCTTAVGWVNGRLQCRN